MRILLVEDDARIAALVQRGLVGHHYSVDIAGDGELGLELALVNEYDLVILDIMLPKMDGRAVCRALRAEECRTPILMLTALDTNDQIIGALDDGADDYLSKPFDFGVLLARIRSLIRRNGEARQAAIEADGLVVDTASRTVLRDGISIALTAKEFALLEFLVLNKGKAMSRNAICEHVWDINFDARSNVVDSLIRVLRQKVDLPGTQSLIHTVRGYGYRFGEPSVY
jgi:two-component system, OmpR family, copper resistance phosphate regulon response regulator CusR